jgi:hypothetical protein
VAVTTKLPPPPARPGGDEGGGGSDWVELMRARDDIDAHLLTGRLHGAGVETRTIKDRRAPGAWLIGGSNPWAPVTVFVRRRQLEDARLVLAEISLEWGGPPASPGIKEGLATAWWLVAVALGVVLTVIALMQAAAVASAGAGGRPAAAVGRPP